MFETVGVIGKHGDPRVAETVGRLVDFLVALPVDVLFDADSVPVESVRCERVARGDLGERCDLVIVVAGDGTFLGAARGLVAHDVALLGVNLGRLGFLADIMPAEMSDRLAEIFDGRRIEERRWLLDVTVRRGSEEGAMGTALNEVVVHKSNIARLIEYQTFVDERPVSSQRADGLVVSTPTGSTAYALSGGGPIVHPDLEAIVLVPICPHTLSSRPLVVPARCEVEVRMASTEETEAQVTCDGQSVHDLEVGDSVRIVRHPRPLRLIHPVGYDYFATLRAKLHWARAL